MLLEKAQEIIENNSERYMVHFEASKRTSYVADYFPEKSENEPLFESEEVAWSYARQFAKVTKGTYFNIYVVKSDYKPVDNYKKEMLNVR